MKSPASQNSKHKKTALFHAFPERIANGGMLLAWCLCIWPVLFVLLHSFTDANGLPSLHALRVLLADSPRLTLLLSHTLILTGGTVLLSLSFGIPLGFLCFRTDLPGRLWLGILLPVGACVPLFVQATAWIKWLGLPGPTLALAAACWIQGIAYTPLAALICGLAFSLNPKEIEQNLLLDTDSFTVARHSILRLGGWGIASAAIIIATLSLTSITVTDLLMVRCFAEEVFTQFQLGAGVRQAAAAAFPILIPTALGMLYLAHLLRQRTLFPVTPQLHPLKFSLGSYRRILALIFIVVCVLLFLGVPLFSLLITIGRPHILVTAVRTCLPELGLTLLLTPPAAAITVFLAFSGAWALARSQGWTRVGAGLVVTILLAIPDPLIGVGLAQCLNRPGLFGLLYDSPAILILSWVIRTLPFAVLALLPAVGAIPRELDDLAALDGLSLLQRQIRLGWPLAWRGLLAAWLLSLTLALSEVGASFLVTPPGCTTLTIRFYTLIHYGLYPVVAGMSLILLVCALVPAVGLAFLMRNWLRRML